VNHAKLTIFSSTSCYVSFSCNLSRPWDVLSRRQPFTGYSNLIRRSLGFSSAEDIVSLDRYQTKIHQVKRLNIDIFLLQCSDHCGCH
jgi:hypothetical protein